MTGSNRSTSIRLVTPRMTLSATMTAATRRARTWKTQTKSMPRGCPVQRQRRLWMLLLTTTKNDLVVLLHNAVAKIQGLVRCTPVCSLPTCPFRSVPARLLGLRARMADLPRGPTYCYASCCSTVLQCEAPDVTGPMQSHGRRHRQVRACAHRGALPTSKPEYNHYE
jgi:hypothetical protein